MVVVREKSVGLAQVDEIAEQYFGIKGIINLDRTDVAHTLKGENGLLIVARQENEDNGTFLKSLFERLLQRPGVKDSNCFLFYFGSPADHPLRMSDMNTVQEFCGMLDSDESDIIWGIFRRAEGEGMAAIVLCSKVQ